MNGLQKKIHGQFARDMEDKDKNNYISYTECGKLAQKKYKRRHVV